jgi:EAL domain-containing protein (putative c-di-GMP-specific phosphodiesterase class I)
MYAAKQRGRNQIAYASGGQQSANGTNRQGHPSLETELAAAITNGELRLLYQPVVDISPGVDAPVLVGAEALLRWQHPRLGLLLPAAFLPTAEETGLIADMDLWALTTACRAASSWVDTPRGAPVVAINLSSAALADPRLPLTIRGALAESRLAPERLHLEVVESRSLLDVPGLADRLKSLRRIGIRVSLDDFGTGFSCLTWLQELPVDRIKVDRSFISKLGTDAASRAVIRGVLALAGEVGIGVVAEGVETPEQAIALLQAGCTFVQGYLFGRPAATDPSETIQTAGVLRRAILAPGSSPRLEQLRYADELAASD